MTGDLANYPPRPMPRDLQLEGHWVRLAPLAIGHASDLFAANTLDETGKNWTYLPYGSFASLDDYQDWVASIINHADPYFLAIIEKATNRAVGVASFLRIKPVIGVIEVGHIHFSPLLQGTTGATEAMFLMMQWAFDMGYRRYEWKCDAKNLPSRRAAQRLGLSYEGIFRQATIVKGRNRDTAWFACIDKEWPALRTAFERYLDLENFDDQGNQITRLSSLTQAIRVASDPQLS